VGTVNTLPATLFHGTQIMHDLYILNRCLNSYISLSLHSLFAFVAVRKV
jgi:hypothetical protein